MMNAHMCAVEIENILRELIGCKRGGIAGIIDADFIERHLYVSIATGLGYLYSKGNSDTRNQIETFISKFGFYLELGLKTLLDFKTNEKEINGDSYSIDYKNGEEAVKAIISELSKMCK